MNKIPTIDFSKITSGSGPCSQDDWKNVAKEVFKALNGIGFAYIINHGVSSNTIETAFKESLKFFQLPQDVKMKSLKDISKSFNGYAAAGQETLHPDVPFELRDSYDICGNLRYFPNPLFQSALTKLENESKPLIKTILKTLSIALDLEDDDFFINKTKNLDNYNIPSFTTLRTLYYPPIEDRNSIAPGTVRCGDHTDYGTLTILYQDLMGGLEVQAVNGEWVSADPIPNTVLVNTGDLLEFWSGGMFPATHHRVLIPEQELQQKCSRQSIVYFIHPDHSTVIQPLKGKNDNYEPVTAKQHAEMRLRKSYNY